MSAIIDPTLVIGFSPDIVTAFLEDAEGHEQRVELRRDARGGGYTGEGDLAFASLAEVRASFWFLDLTTPCPYCSEFSEDFTLRNKAHWFNGGILAQPDDPVADVVKFVPMRRHVWYGEGQYMGDDYSCNICGAC